MDYKAEADKLRPALVERRRDLHRHPELAFEETRTAGIVAEELSRLGLEVQPGIGQTGVVGVLEGAADGPTILWRADMDALPIQEENDVPYQSTVAGKMHACGHDGHVAIALGIARLLCQQKDHLKGRVKFVFQPAEEIVSGAAAMIADGVLESPRPDVSLGLHLWNNAPVGQVGVVAGPMMAGSSFIDVTITGKGGHAAMPADSQDPVVCAAHIVVALQTIVSRNIDPDETAVLSITRVTGSDAHNIIPEQATLAGTLRTYSVAARDLATERIHEICESMGQAMRCRVQVTVRHASVPVVNDATVAARARDAFAQVIPPEQIDADMRTMASEDVSLFMQDVPGLYFFVGSASAEHGKDYPHHHARFDFDEDALPLAVALGAAAIGDYVL
jgi:amidohydrolase